VGPWTAESVRSRRQGLDWTRGILDSRQDMGGEKSGDQAILTNEEQKTPDDNNTRTWRSYIPVHYKQRIPLATY